MLKHFLLCVSLLFVYPVVSFASFGYRPPGPESLALSYSGAAGPVGVLSAFNNPALLPSMSAGMATSYRNYYGIRNLADVAIGAVFKFKGWPLALSAEQRGFNLYSETTLTIASAYRINKTVSVGVSIPVYALKIKNYGQASTVGITAAIHYKVFDNLQIAAIGGNLNMPTLGRANESVPVYGTLALAYSPTGNMDVYLDIYKEDIMPFEYRLGARFQISPVLHLLAGFREGINSYSAGMDVKVFSYHIQYGMEFHPRLNISHTFGLSYDF